MRSSNTSATNAWQFTKDGLPIVSVDTKKKEQGGRFKNPGRIWSRESLPVNDHDFPSLGSGVAIPRGLYDPQADRGWVMVGTSHDTAEFAVDAIADWWRGPGRRRYPMPQSCSSWPTPVAVTVLVADSGSWPCKKGWSIVTGWQYGSKRVPLSHRGLQMEPDRAPALREMSKHCAGQPFTDYATILRLIGGTGTRTGLQVKCALNTTVYPTKVKVSDAQMSDLDIFNHSFFPEWNYTLFPRVIRN